MAWDYAELSKTAKEAGGPEKLMDTVESTARAEGRSEMAPWIGLTAIAASGITYGITKLVRYFKEKKAISQDALKKAKEELGWEAQYGIEDMCADSWRWQKNNPNGYED